MAYCSSAPDHVRCEHHRGAHGPVHIRTELLEFFRPAPRRALVIAHRVESEDWAPAANRELHQLLVVTLPGPLVLGDQPQRLLANAAVELGVSLICRAGQIVAGPQGVILQRRGAIPQPSFF